MWTETILTDSFGSVAVAPPLGFQVDNQRRLHLVYSANNGTVLTKVRYRTKPFVGPWTTPEDISEANLRWGYYGISLTLQNDEGPAVVPHVSFILEPTIGIVFRGYRTN